MAEDTNRLEPSQGRVRRSLLTRVQARRRGREREEENVRGDDAPVALRWAARHGGPLAAVRGACPLGAQLPYQEHSLMDDSSKISASSTLPLPELLALLHQSCT